MSLISFHWIWIIKNFGRIHFFFCPILFVLLNLLILKSIKCIPTFKLINAHHRIIPETWKKNSRSQQLSWTNLLMLCGELASRKLWTYLLYISSYHVKSASVCYYYQCRISFKGSKHVCQGHNLLCVGRTTYYLTIMWSNF